MPVRTVIILIHESEDGELTIVDATGSERRAKNALGAWVAIKQILSNPNLPPIEKPRADHVQIESAMTEFVESQMPPGLNRLAGPAVAGLLEFGRKISRRKHTR